MNAFRPGFTTKSQRLYETTFGTRLGKSICRVCQEEIRLGKPHHRCEEKAMKDLPNQRHPKG